MQPSFAEYQWLVQGALSEDIGRGDLTAQLLIPERQQAKLTMVAREEMVVCGLWLVMETFNALGDEIGYEMHVDDGAVVAAGTKLMDVHGRAQAILTGERTALNFLQRLSSVATITKRYVNAAGATHARILDTRKTMPGFRALDKYAVRMGGGMNHRFRLDDGILIKDNHIALCGGVTQAAAAAKASAPALIKIEMECDTLEQVAEANAAGVDVIMLDNMTTDQMRAAVSTVRASGSGVKLEASGNVTLETVGAIAETGVDFISVGRITHSAPTVDIGLDMVMDGA